jgi:2-dehydropantoate 2-reductase
MPQASRSLRIAVLGSGKIGSAFAFQLARTGGHDVTVIARPGSTRLAQLEADQAIVNIRGERAIVRVADRLDEETPYDLVIVTLLAHQTAPLLPILARSAARCIQFMFNTFQPEILRDAIGADRSAFGMPFIQATLDEQGRLNAIIGAGGQKTIMNQQGWVDVFNAAGLPAALEPNMMLWLRCHAPLCVAFESVSVAGERRGGGASWSQAIALASGVHAAYAVIKSLGYDIYPVSKRRLNACPSWITASMLWFMSRVRLFRELLATGQAECRALADAMAMAAPPETPTSLVSKIVAMKPS